MSLFHPENYWSLILVSPLFHVCHVAGNQLYLLAVAFILDAVPCCCSVWGTETMARNSKYMILMALHLFSSLYERNNTCPHPWHVTCHTKRWKPPTSGCSRKGYSMPWTEVYGISLAIFFLGQTLQNISLIEFPESTRNSSSFFAKLCTSFYRVIHDGESQPWDIRNRRSCHLRTVCVHYFPCPSQLGTLI